MTTEQSSSESTNPGSAPRVLVALDIDGVLNVNGLRSTRSGDGAVGHLRSAEIRLEASDIPASPFVNGTGTGLNLTVRWDPDVIAWLLELSTRAQLVWATTWEHAANSHFGPVVGLPELDVVEHSATAATMSTIRNGDIAAWKIEGIHERFGDRPVVWLDDSASSFTHYETWWGTGQPLKVIAPDRAVGITVEHRELVEAFVAAHS